MPPGSARAATYSTRPWQGSDRLGTPNVAREMVRAEARVRWVENLLRKFLDETGLAASNSAQAAAVLEAVLEGAEAVVAMGEAASDPPSLDGKAPMLHR